MKRGFLEIMARAQTSWCSNAFLLDLLSGEGRFTVAYQHNITNFSPFPGVTGYDATIQ